MSEIKDFIQGKSSKDASLIEKAFLYAQKAHAGQKRASGETYMVHLAEVARILDEMKMDAATVAAGFLHDTLEDTAATEDDLSKAFGHEVLFLVKGATKIKGIEEKEKSHTSAKTIMKMFLATAEDIRVILIKLADRLHNLKTLEYLPPEKQKLIALESVEIYGPMAGRLNMGEMKRKIEDLAFPYAMPKEYRWLISETGEYLKERTKYVEKIRPKVLRHLYDNGITDFKLDYRVKHLYSLYKKLLLKDKNVELIHDLAAFRIILPTVAGCYETLGVIHKKYRPLPGLIKDYIALPKPNGYQSLHTTVFCEEGKIAEFQIRTDIMHDNAENGIAAHWAYKEAARGNGAEITNRAELAWVNKIKNWKKNIQNPEEFFDALKLEVFKDRIFVFTPQGDIKDLPAGSTPIDFAYAIHSEIGDRCGGAKVNGKMVALAYELQNGDVCDIMTSRGQKPSRDWLNIAKTPDAKKRIRNAIKTPGAV